jgi:hypothetical protein
MDRRQEKKENRFQPAGAGRQALSRSFALSDLGPSAPRTSWGDGSPSACATRPPATQRRPAWCRRRPSCGWRNCCRKRRSRDHQQPSEPLRPRRPTEAAPERAFEWRWRRHHPRSRLPLSWLAHPGRASARWTGVSWSEWWRTGASPFPESSRYLDSGARRQLTPLGGNRPLFPTRQDRARLDGFAQFSGAEGKRPGLARRLGFVKVWRFSDEEARDRAQAYNPSDRQTPLLRRGVPGQPASPAADGGGPPPSQRNRRRQMSQGSSSTPSCSVRCSRSWHGRPSCSWG